MLLFRRRLGLSDLLGHSAWLVAMILYLSALIRIRRMPGLAYQKGWLVLLTALTFAAFGEAISWGQDFFHFQSPEWVQGINIQEETNIHNLNLAKLLGIPPSSPFYDYLEDASDLLEPVFFFICYSLFVFVPLMKKMRFFQAPVIQQSVVTGAAVTFLILNLPAYFIVDTLTPVAGHPLVPAADELYETALALGVLVAALDTRRTLPQWSQRTKPF